MHFSKLNVLFGKIKGKEFYKIRDLNVLNYVYVHRNGLSVILTLVHRLHQPPELHVFLYHLRFIPDKEPRISSVEAN